MISSMIDSVSEGTNNSDNFSIHCYSLSYLYVQYTYQNTKYIFLIAAVDNCIHRTMDLSKRTILMILGPNNVQKIVEEIYHTHL